MPFDSYLAAVPNHRLKHTLTKQREIPTNTDQISQSQYVSESLKWPAEAQNELIHSPKSTRFFFIRQRKITNGCCVWSILHPPTLQQPPPLSWKDADWWSPTIIKRIQMRAFPRGRTGFLTSDQGHVPTKAGFNFWDVNRTWEFSKKKIQKASGGGWGWGWGSDINSSKSRNSPSLRIEMSNLTSWNDVTTQKCSHFSNVLHQHFGNGAQQRPQLIWEGLGADRNSWLALKTQSQVPDGRHCVI